MGLKTVGVVFAAGRGSRLRPLTDTMPKPLAKVGDKTLLSLNMEKVFDLIDEYIIVVSYLQDLIIKELGNEFQGKRVEYVHQENNKGGTLDAFRSGIYGSKNTIEANYIVINSDEIHGDDIYNQFYGHIKENPELALLSAKKFEDKSKLSSFGIYEVDNQNNFITIWEKPEKYISNLVNTGIYYFPNKVKEFITQEPNLDLENEHYITRDLFIPYSQKYPIKVLVSNGLWFPITSLVDLELAQTEVRL